MTTPVTAPPAGPDGPHGSSRLEQIRDDAEKVLARPRPRMRVALAHLASSAVLVTVFYAAEPLWALWPRVHDIVFERSLWSHVIVVVSLLAVADLLVKWGLGVLFGGFDPSAAGLPRHGRLSPRHLARLASFVRRAPWYRRDGVWDRRLATALLQFGRGEPRDGVRETLRVQAEMDEVSLASRYTLLKLLLWAVPLLGFIGTVEGIGSGVGHFSLQLRDQTAVEQPAVGDGVRPASEPDVGGSLDRVRGSLQEVTGGLGRAFDTTYLALVLAVILMAGMSLLEKVESDRLVDFDEFCQIHFVPRLPARPQSLTDELQSLADNVQAFRRSVREAEEAAAGIAGLADTVERIHASLDAGVDLRLSVVPPSGGRDGER